MPKFSLESVQRDAAIMKASYPSGIVDGLGLALQHEMGSEETMTIHGEEVTGRIVGAWPFDNEKVVRLAFRPDDSSILDEDDNVPVKKSFVRKSYDYLNGVLGAATRSQYSQPGTTMSNLIGIANRAGLAAYTPLSKAKSTSTGTAQLQEDAATIEDRLINEMIDALSGKSQEDKDRIVKRLSARLSSTPSSRVLTSGEVAIPKPQMPVAKSYEDTLAALLRPSTQVHKSGEAASVLAPHLWRFQRG
jgi:hypothetical protein